MASTLRTRPNHYELLGISPSASADDVARAFAGAMGLFSARPMVAAAQLSAAFETLRDPARRRVYDQAIGLRPVPQLRQWSIAASVPADGVMFRPVASGAPIPAQPADEPKTASFIASSLREIAKPGPYETAPAPPPKEEERLVAPPVRVEEALEADERPFEWKRPALAVGAFIVVAGLVGALAGVSVRDDEQQQARPAVGTPVGRPKMAAAIAPPAVAVVESAATAPSVEGPVRARPVAVRTTAPRPVEQVETVAAQQVDQTAAPDAGATAPAETAAADVAVEQPPTRSADAQPAAVAAPQPAAMPLPNGVIARTIERIGYACGAVASASAAGPNGVFKISCTSGQSYQATPIGGRYRFRRLGKR